VVTEVVDEALEKVDIVRDHVDEDIVRVLDMVRELDIVRT
jgi:hypothetical protein